MVFLPSPRFSSQVGDRDFRLGRGQAVERDLVVSRMDRDTRLGLGVVERSIRLVQRSVRPRGRSAG